MTEFKAGDIVKLKKSTFDHHGFMDIDKFHYFILARNSRINYDVLHVNSLTKHSGVNLDEYELA